MATEASVSVSKKNGPYPLAILKTHDKEEFQQFESGKKQYPVRGGLSGHR
jgi:hypothetical protein